VLLDGAATLQIGGDRVALHHGEWVLLLAATPRGLLHTRPGTNWLAVHLDPGPPDPSNLPGDDTEARRLVERFYNDAWNRWDDDIVEHLLAEKFEFRGTLGDELHGRDEWRAYRDRIRRAVPDSTTRSSNSSHRRA
jgi:SnoaL-like polyketide cyclase